MAETQHSMTLRLATLLALFSYLIFMCKLLVS